MDTQTLKAMADRLQELADGAEPDIDCLGICLEVKCAFGDKAKKYLQDKWHLWPEYSGCKVLPVPHPRLNYADAYELEDNLWSGEYGAARRRLCGFLAQKIREEIGDDTN